MAESKFNVHPLSAQPSPESGSPLLTTCPHGYGVACPICATLNEMLRILSEPVARMKPAKEEE